MIALIANIPHRQIIPGWDFQNRFVYRPARPHLCYKWRLPFFCSSASPVLQDNYTKHLTTGEKG